MSLSQNGGRLWLGIIHTLPQSLTTPYKGIWIFKVQFLSLSPNLAGIFMYLDSDLFKIQYFYPVSYVVKKQEIRYFFNIYSEISFILVAVLSLWVECLDNQINLFCNKYFWKRDNVLSRKNTIKFVVQNVYFWGY